jgi:hypothetical protein
MSTTYIIQANGEEIGTRSDKEAAIKFADAAHAENAGMLEVTVATDHGTVVHTIASIAESDEPEVETVVEGEDDEEPETEVATSARTKPWTKTAVATFEAPEIEGYTLAYTRSRTKTGVYRANDKSGWLVLDTRSGERFEFENTATARTKTNALEAAYKVARAEQLAREKAAKAEEAAAKKAKAADDKAAKEAAKAEAKAAKEAAKAAAEVAEAAEEAPAEAELETVDA